MRNGMQPVNSRADSLTDFALKVPACLRSDDGREFQVLAWEPRAALDEPVTATITVRVMVPDDAE